MEEVPWGTLGQPAAAIPGFDHALDTGPQNDTTGMKTTGANWRGSRHYCPSDRPQERETLLRVQMQLKQSGTTLSFSK